MNRSNWTHVCPAWIAGPRAAHPKFGGGIIIGGIPLVEDRLLAIHERFPDDRSSGHNFLEVKSGGQYGRFDSQNAIDFGRLVEGISNDEFPLWSAMTNPCFGLRGVENGGILSANPYVVDMCRTGHNTAIERSEYLAAQNIGLGHVIWWPAFDSRLHRGPLSKMSWEEGRDRLLAFWVSVLSRSEAIVFLEYKPSVPGQLDFFPTMQAAIDFCRWVNDQVGWKAMQVNLEWAHALIGGQFVEDATRMQVNADLFGGFVHVNSAELAIVEWDESGTNIVAGTPGDDADWAVGEGGKERWEDQVRAVAILDALGVEIAAEHDIDPAGEDPMECYARSRANLELMIQQARTLGRIA